MRNEFYRRIAFASRAMQQQYEVLATPEDWASLIKLLEEHEILRQAIRAHRAQKADDRCIEDDDRLYKSLGDGIKCDRRVGSKEEMLKNCARFIDRRCEDGNWPTYEQLRKVATAAKRLLKKVRSCCGCGKYLEQVHVQKRLEAAGFKVTHEA